MNTASKTEIPGAGRGRGAKLVLSPISSDVLPSRRWGLVWPREHGAWGILLVALITGAAAGLSSKSSLLPLLWLGLAAVAAFCLRAPIENALPSSPFRPRHRAEWRWVAVAASVYLVCGAFSASMLWLDGAMKLIWEAALAAVALFALQAVVKRAGRSNRLLAEMIGAFGLALAAAAGCAVAAGKMESEALVLWLLNGLFAANQILYVQFRIRESRGPSSLPRFNPKLLLLGSEVVTALAVIAGAKAGLLPGLALVAFLPVFVRGSVWSLRTDHPPLHIHRLGKTELTHAIVFGIVLIAAFRIL